MERKVLIKALVGSHNYNLNDENSDKDYKIFVAPTFDDLYENKMYSTSKIGKTEDYDVHDIRKLTELWWKSNINFVEVLYSNEVLGQDLNWCKTPDDFIKATEVSTIIDNIWNMRDEIVTMNLPYFYSACKGMYFNKMSLLEKGTEGTIHLVKKYGYDTKQALHSYRVLDFIERFAFSEFKDFKWSITYDKYDREKILDIKYGKYTLDEFKHEAEIKFSRFEKLEEKYKSQNPKEDVKNELTKNIKEIVKLCTI